MKMSNRQFKIMAIGFISVWMAIFAALPLLLTFLLSLFKPSTTQVVVPHLTLHNYVDAFHYLYIRIFLHSMLWAVFTTVLCLVVAYPFAYAMAKMPSKYRALSLLLIMVPFWTSSLIRTYAMMTIIKAKGLLNHCLIALHIIHAPLQILYTPVAVEIGLVYTLLPFMILPLYANLEKFDWRLVEAARDLGATPWTSFSKVVLPVSMPGIVSGVLLVFLPSITLFYIPEVLGGAKSFLLGNLIKYQFLDGSNWPLGAAMSTLLLLFLLLMIGLYRLRHQRKNAGLFV